MYAGFCNHFNIGAFMEKGLTMAAGQVRQQAFALWCMSWALVSLSRQELA